MNENTILLVEDNPDDEALALRALRKNSIDARIVVARDGVEALDYLLGSVTDGAPESVQPLPRVVLLDLKLPRIDGLEVLRRIRANKRTQFLPVVILTSSREEQDLASAYRFWANSYIRKPVDYTEFVEAVRQIGVYWLVLNELPPV